MTFISRFISASLTMTMSRDDNPEDGSRLYSQEYLLCCLQQHPWKQLQHPITEIFTKNIIYTAPYPEYCKYSLKLSTCLLSPNKYFRLEVGDPAGQQSHVRQQVGEVWNAGKYPGRDCQEH